MAWPGPSSRLWLLAAAAGAWLGHLLVFGLLFALVLGWFYLQTRQARQVFLDDAAARAHLLTDAVLLHTRGALLAEAATTTLLGRVLGNSARFIDYLGGTATPGLSIANDGFALPAAEAARCLEPWFTTKPTGTGLGLALSRRIIAAQGGTLRLEVPRPGRLCVQAELSSRPPPARLT